MERWLLIIVYSKKHLFSSIYFVFVTSFKTFRKFVRATRKRFLRLTELCGDFDDMMSVLLMFSYLLDIVMICLVLRMVAFAFTDMTSRLVTSTWLVLPVTSLFIFSCKASQLYDIVSVFEFVLNYNIFQDYLLRV